MATQEFNLLAPFGTTDKDKWFRTAYKWQKPEIFAWMEKVTKGQAGGSQAQDPDHGAIRDALTAIFNNIKALSNPDGQIWKDTRLQPNSHIARLLNRAWDGRNKEISKFFVVEWPYRPTMFVETGRVPGWWSPYDLLGLFLSLLGPAPEAANKNNYFLPLTAVYARWCSRIAGRAPRAFAWSTPNGGAGDWPYMFQCTWQLIEDGAKQRSKWFFLGASTGGDEFRNNVGTWRVEVQRQRFNTLFSCQRIGMVQRLAFEQSSAPEQTLPDGSKVPFGNCAETYPFIARVIADKRQNKTLQGLALGRLFMQNASQPEYNEYADGEIWTSLRGPCRNCKLLLHQAGASYSQFFSGVDKADAPKRTTSS